MQARARQVLGIVLASGASSPPDDELLPRVLRPFRGARGIFLPV